MMMSRSIPGTSTTTRARPVSRHQNDLADVLRFLQSAQPNAGLREWDDRIQQRFNDAGFVELANGAHLLREHRRLAEEMPHVDAGNRTIVGKELHRTELGDAQDLPEDVQHVSFRSRHQVGESEADEPPAGLEQVVALAT